jgi:hypothetical protein
MLDIPAVNQGVGGNTSSQIDVRYNAGGAHQTVTLAGNQIPVSGSVQATFPSGWQPVTSSGGNNGAACYQSLTGQGTNATINGVAGVFTYAGGNYSFTPTVYPPSPVTTVVNNPYTVATPYAGYFLVDSSGTNDVNQNVPLATVIANDKAMAALAGNRFIVASALPFDLPSYMPGGTAAISLANLNAAKASTFGNHYADTLTPLLDGCGPVPGGALAAMDALDIANGIVPTSCRAYNGSKIAANINSTQTTVCLSGAYPAVGEKGYFSHVTDPVGGFEAFLITAIVTPGTCSTGSQMTVVRGYAGTVAGTYLANQDSWGFWDRVHLSGGAPNTAVAAKTGYAIQAEAIAEAYRILTESAAP